MHLGGWVLLLDRMKVGFHGRSRPRTSVVADPVRAQRLVICYVAICKLIATVSGAMPEYKDFTAFDTPAKHIGPSCRVRRYIRRFVRTVRTNGDDLYSVLGKKRHHCPAYSWHVTLRVSCGRAHAVGRLTLRENSSAASSVAASNVSGSPECGKPCSQIVPALRAATTLAFETASGQCRPG